MNNEEQLLSSAAELMATRGALSLCITVMTPHQRQQVLQTLQNLAHDVGADLQALPPCGQATPARHREIWEAATLRAYRTLQQTLQGTLDARPG